jgi:hypothetical protein
MDDPAKRYWRGKIETRVSLLARGLFFRWPSRLASASKLLFIRAHPVIRSQNAFGSLAARDNRYKVSGQKF